MKYPLPLRKLICAVQGVQWLSDEDVVFQDGFDGCGEACIRMVLRHFNKSEELPGEVVSFRGNGLSLSDISYAVKRYDLSVQSYTGASIYDVWYYVEHLEKVLVLIVLKGFHIPYMVDGLGHLVILTDVNDERIILTDPFLGKVIFPEEKLHKRWSGKCLVIGTNGE